MTPDLAGKLLSVASAALWAGAVIFFKKSTESLSSLQGNFLKNVLGTLLFGLTLPLLGAPILPHYPARYWLVTLLSGLVGLALGDVLFFAALRRLGAGLNAIVDALYSPFVFLLSVLLLSEPVTLGILLGGPLVVSGLVLASRSPLSHGPRRLAAGLLLGAASMFSMALGIVILKPILVAAHTWWVIFWRTAAGTLATGAILLALKRPLWPKSHSGLAHLWAGAFLGTYLATAAWLFGMRLTSVTAAAILNQLSTFFVLLAAAVWLAEPLERRRIAGAVLAFLGGTLVILLTRPL